MGVYFAIRFAGSCKPERSYQMPEVKPIERIERLPRVEPIDPSKYDYFRPEPIKPNPFRYPGGN